VRQVLAGQVQLAMVRALPAAEPHERRPREQRAVLDLPRARKRRPIRREPNRDVFGIVRARVRDVRDEERAADGEHVECARGRPVRVLERERGVRARAAQRHIQCGGGLKERREGESKDGCKWWEHAWDNNLAWKKLWPLCKYYIGDGTAAIMRTVTCLFSRSRRAVRPRRGWIVRRMFPNHVSTLDLGIYLPCNAFR
jgi:hypothetical protein